MLLCSSYVVMSCLWTLVTWSQHKVFFRVVVTWRYVTKHGGHLLEQCSLEQKADFHRHLNRIVILPSGLLSGFFDFTYPSPHNPHFPPMISSHSPARFNSYLLAHATAILKTYSVPYWKRPRNAGKDDCFDYYQHSVHQLIALHENTIKIVFWFRYDLVRSKVTVQDPVGWPTAILRFY